MSYLIKVEYKYYSNNLGSPANKYLTRRDLLEDNKSFQSNSDEIAVFETEEEAQIIIDEMKNGKYYLNNGEYSRPVYEIINENNALTGAVLPSQREEIGNFALFVPNDNLKKLIDDQYLDVDYYNDFIWCKITEINNKEYMIAYELKPEAVQYCDSEGLGLGCLNWGEPSYYYKIS